MRRARETDVESLRRIYNQMIEEDEYCLQIDFIESEDCRNWLLAHDKRHPFYVGEIEGEVVCWVSLAPYSVLYPYDWVAELSVCVRQDLRGKGLGGLLLKFIEQQAVRLGYYKIVLSCYTNNLRALHAFRHAGYRDIGVFRNHGYHKGRLVDMMYMERLLAADLENLKDYYSRTYPFYADYFEEEELLAEQELYLEDFEEIPVEDPAALPDGIVRFFKRKTPEQTTPRRWASSEVRRRRQEARRAAEEQAKREENPETEEPERDPGTEQLCAGQEEKELPAAPEQATPLTAQKQAAILESDAQTAETVPAAEPITSSTEISAGDEKPKARKKQPSKAAKPRKTVHLENEESKVSRPRRKKTEDDPEIPMEGQLSLGDIISPGDDEKGN